MKQLAIFLLIAAWAVALAQVPPDGQPREASAVPDTTVPCVPAGEASPPEDKQVNVDPASKPCVEPSPETFPEEEPFLGEDPDGMEDDPEGFEEEFGGVIDENALPTEASPEEEFKPGDEISEDYPVPLPSDI